MTRVVGFDLSLNHGAGVLLVENQFEACRYYTNVAGSAVRGSDGTRLKLLKTKDKQALAMDRLVQVEAWFKDSLDLFRPDIVAIEDYAYAAASGAHQIGEVGGVARLACWRAGVRYRLFDPLSLKMFVAHDATAQKDQIERAVLDRWGHDFSRVNAPSVKGKKAKRVSSEDLSDAYGLAVMVHVENEVRAGRLSLEQLEHDKERQIFNRVTKAYPVNLLGREWIQNPKPGGNLEAVLDREIRRHGPSRPAVAKYLLSLQRKANG